LELHERVIFKSGEGRVPQQPSGRASARLCAALNEKHQ